MKELQNKIIGVFFGGKSPEHEISIITGEFVISQLRKMGLEIVAVYVDKKGVWYSDKKLSKLNFFKDDYEKKLKNIPSHCLDLELSQKKLVLQRKSLFNKDKIQIDFIFPTFHGLYGEDGAIQGLSEFFYVPYAGCGIYTSSISIDKCLTKKFLTLLKLPTTDFLIFHKKEFINNRASVIEKIKKTLMFPIFIKPARTGSSIGITKVKDDKALLDALNLAFYYDVKVVIENSVESVADLTCSVISDGNKVITSEIQESIFESDLLDYHVKYLKDGGVQTGNAKSNLVIPANISDKHADQIKSYSKHIFNEIDANGIIRVDFLLNKQTGDLFVNEINTLPGTLYHHLWEKSGFSIDKVLEQMLTHGFGRWKEAQDIQSDFKSGVLNNANQLKLQQYKDCKVSKENKALH